MIQKKRIALVGGAGFIGHNLALGLKASGHDVHVIDSLHVNNFLSLYSTDNEHPHRELYLKMITERLDLLKAAKIPTYVQDAREYHQLCHLLARVKPQTIVLLAAVAHADRSNKDPYSTFDHSLRTLENALDYARGGSVEHFVYFSSSMVYGNFTSGLVDETTPCEPIGIYGALKYAGEKITLAYNQTFGLPYTIIRPSALYGERCVSGRVGQQFIENAIQGKEVTIKGSGEDRLDFTYVGDLVDGVIRTIESDKSRNEIFNLTYGASRSLREMAEILKSRFPSVKVNYVPKDKLMPDRGTLSVEKARKLLGYQPSFPLEKGYARYIDWYRSFWPKT